MKYSRVVNEALLTIEQERKISTKAAIKACDKLIKSMEKHEKSGKLGKVIYPKGSKKVPALQKHKDRKNTG